MLETERLSRAPRRLTRRAFEHSLRLKRGWKVRQLTKWWTAMDPGEEVMA